jgi:hypothetical protein
MVGADEMDWFPIVKQLKRIQAAMNIRKGASCVDRKTSCHWAYKQTKNPMVMNKGAIPAKTEKRRMYHHAITTHPTPLQWNSTAVQNSLRPVIV